MIHYLLIDASGKIFQRGICGSRSEIPSIPEFRSEVISESDPRQPWSSVEYTYRDYRRAAYPTTGEQMDMLWHAMNTGAMPKVEPFYGSIKAVKEKYPK